jgi:hypothetical protein
LTACSQHTSTDSLCFSKEQAAQILKDIKKGEICDSIRTNQALQIINFKDVVKKDNEIIHLHENRISVLEKDLNTANTKLKITKRIANFGIPIAIGGGFIIGILLN